MPHTRAYRNGVLVAQDFGLADLSDHLKDDATIIWVDLTRPTPQDLALAAAELNLHHLALEDATVPRQRPKVDRYREHLFLTMYETHLSAGQVTSHEISVFATARALITVHQDDEVAVAEIARRWDTAPEDLLAHGIGFLVHGLLDHVVDSHFATVERLDDEVESLEDLVFEDTAENQNVIYRHSYRVRRNIVELRRVALPMREAVNTLMRRDLAMVTDDLAPYYQDVYDHVLRVSDWTDTLRDLITTALETNLTIQGNRLNETMKQVTSWAAIVAVPTAITGFFGQNVPFPGFGEWPGFLASVLGIVFCSLLLYVTFRRRNWL